MDGVVSTCVGYAGGEKDHPTYHDLGNHAEALRLEFDPAKLSYEEILRLFWQGNHPSRPPWSRQYMSALFPVGDVQTDQARRSKAELAERLGREIYTEILPDATFWPAEDYHQKYLLRRCPEVQAELHAMLPGDALFASTAAARINGFLGGNGTARTFDAEIDDYGLSEKAKDLLRRHRPPESRSSV